MICWLKQMSAADLADLLNKAAESANKDCPEPLYVRLLPLSTAN